VVESCRVLPLTDWQNRAACFGFEDMFANSKPSPRTVLATVRAFCDRCPVRDECGDYADVTEATWGIWAGEWRGKRNGRVVAK
jgi:Transcription factor WhiB